MPDSKKVLVVGTTSDYIDWIRSSNPGRALFLTEPAVRRTAGEPAPADGEEILVPLTDLDQVRSALARHMETFGITLTGAACFDCESMALTARLAGIHHLPYHSLAAIENCRDKQVSKQLWHQNQIPAPDIALVNRVEDVIRFCGTKPDGIVLKPFFGSGSELVFKCTTPLECRDAFQAIKTGLETRAAHPLFRNNGLKPHLMLAEEEIPGPEFSCDFVIEKNRVNFIRTTRKIKLPSRPFGTVTGYVLPSKLPGNDDISIFEPLFLKAARSLGIEHGICMADFIFRDNHPVFIEITPRPGGDCLPGLIRESSGLDMLSLTLDIAEKKPLSVEKTTAFTPCVGYRIHACRAGVLKRIRTSGIDSDSRVRDIRLTRKPGHVITMPPLDYDSWLLGHMIIKPDSLEYPETQCLLISKRLQIEIDPA